MKIVLFCSFGYREQQKATSYVRKRYTHQTNQSGEEILRKLCLHTLPIVE